MITILNLSPLRRSFSAKANDLLFEAKMKDITPHKYKDFALPLILILLSKENSVLADEILSNDLVKGNTLLGATFKNYSLPLIATAYETLKISPHILNYIKGSYANRKAASK